jgi:VWFA-related protein
MLRYGARSLACAVAVLLSSHAALPQSAATTSDSQSAVTFKAETNLVLVPVVVRDANGNPVGSLRQEDFQIFDKGKPQTIASFAVERTAAVVPQDRSVDGGKKPPTNPADVTIPAHYVALLFDDLHMKTGAGAIGDFGDLVYSRNAALKFLDTLQPSDRVAIFTSTGQVMLDFTFDRAKLRDTLFKVRASPDLTQGMSACGTQEIVERESRAVVTTSAALVRRMALLPGQRTVVVISSGLILHNESPCAWSLLPETMQLINQAVRARVIFNGIDARGLAVTNSGHSFEQFQAQVTDGTGGRFISDTNDLAGALHRLADTPKYIYVLGFSPGTLKPDGSFHALTVRLTGGHKMDIRARSGYWAPDEKALARGPGQPAAKSMADLLQVDEAESQKVAAEMGVAVAAKQPNVPEAALVTAPAPKPSDREITTRDEPVSFKVRSNLVEVPVVVRDRQGRAVGNLRKEDFRVFDKGKRQEITKFSVQQTAAPAVPDTRAQAAPEGRAPATNSSPGAIGAPVIPNHFVAFLFDDVHVRFEDLPQVRAAVLKYVRSSLEPQDRVALYTTSGRIGVEFTDRPEGLSESLLKIAPNPTRAPNYGTCGVYVSYFQAVEVDQQVGLQPTQQDMAKSLALRVAVEEYGDFNTAVQEIRDAYYSGLQESRTVLAALKIIVRRMAGAPGQRSVVLVSPGFFVPPDLQEESSQLMALAIRSKVLISSVDARGVWANPVFDACHPGAAAAAIQDEAQFRDLDGQANSDELIALADGTGGTVNLNNDFDGGVRNAAGAPEYLYVLDFAPPDLKLDGSFHSLKVTLNSGEHLSVQARRGYWAPKHAEDPVTAAKQEINDAVFSREEMHNLPVEMHTQVTQSGAGATLNVLATMDLKSLHLRKVDDRNRNDVTIVAAVFDANGNFIAGAQKVLQLRLRDETVQWLAQKPPVTIDTNFEMKPGAYLVRLVARDAEDQQITMENAGVQIPDVAAKGN